MILMVGPDLEYLWKKSDKPHIHVLHQAIPSRVSPMPCPLFRNGMTKKLNSKTAFNQRGSGAG